MSVETVEVPDVGSSDPVDVIEVPVKEGDRVEAEDTLIVVESDKATVEVPAPFAGVIKKILIQQGDRVKEGDALMEVDADGAGGDEEQSSAPEREQEQEDDSGKPEAEEDKETRQKEERESGKESAGGGTRTEPVKVPDLGDIEDAELIEFSVREGDEVAEEDNIAVLESDKATVEIPSPRAGKVKRLVANIGDKLSSGDVLMEMEVSGGGEAPASAAKEESGKQEKAPPKKEKPKSSEEAGTEKREEPEERSGASKQPEPEEGKPSGQVHAGPAVRKLARKMGVDLADVKGTGPANRILKEDVQDHVKKLLTERPASGGVAAPSLPEIDFGKWGEVEKVERSKLRKLSASNLHRSWTTIPHVTQHDEADVTDLEAFRKSLNRELERDGVKLTMLAFLVKASARALQAFPDVNASLSNDGEHLIRKHYIHIGIAVDTPNGLVVPVIRDADKKGLVDIALELNELSGKARDRKLSPKDMQGGTFSISSLGGIGGTAFTPVVNWPEVGILGVSRMDTRPVWDGNSFQPRLMLPLSFSYDHRVVDGADAVRFTSYLSRVLTDMRRALL